MILLNGCSRSIPNIQERKAKIFSLLENTKTAQNIKQKNIETKNFDIFTLQNNLKKCKNISVYIEGDGFAWKTRNIISSNPTPLNPIGLKLMLANKNKCSIYLARPCQYINSKNCSKKYWTSHRFSEEIIVSYEEILLKIKNINHNNTFTLLGFSGGGAIATILSTKRNDIKKLITIAGNLDTKAWTDFHDITPLKGSLNPANFTSKLESINQMHFIGKKDNIIPKIIYNSFESKFKNKSNLHHKMFDFGHNDSILLFSTKYLQ